MNGAAPAGIAVCYSDLVLAINPLLARIDLDGHTKAILRPLRSPFRARGRCIRPTVFCFVLPVARRISNQQLRLVFP